MDSLFRFGEKLVRLMELLIFNRYIMYTGFDINWPNWLNINFTNT